ncbi:MAG: hypothetical protein FJ009_01785 [Chloroflexi bacterium]|nr:hypothetical protein [Chloroflexota bacterium]
MLKKIVVAVLIVGLVAIVGVGMAMRFFVPIPTSANNPPNTANVSGTGSQFRGGGQGQGQGVAAQGVQWATLQGNVIAINQSAMTVQTSNGEKVIIENRPWSFALEQGFTAKIGDQLKMNGFYQNGLFEIGQMQNLTNGSAIQVRDQSGRPGWAGRGNNGERGFNTNGTN